MKREKMQLLGLAVLLLCALIVQPCFAEELVPPEFSEAELEIMLPSIVHGEGTLFDISDSEYLNITIASTVTVSLRAESIPEAVTLDIAQSALASSTLLTISGLEPSKVYYKYEDTLDNKIALTADATGTLIFDQDLTSGHLISILRNPSTLFIRNDETGGDCEGKGIGIWSPETKTCTLTTDVDQTISIGCYNCNMDGFTLDGAGHTVQSSGQNHYGVYSNNNNGITVKNIKIRDFHDGISINSGDSHRIENVSVNVRSRGILLRGCGGNNVIVGSTVNAGTNGVHYLSRGYLFLDGNVFNGTGHPQFPGLQGLGLYAGGACATVTNNVFSQFKEGMFFSHIRPCAQLADVREGPENDALLVMNNLITNNGTGIKAYERWGIALIWNNTIEGSSKYGYFGQDRSHNVLESNNFTGNTQSLYFNTWAWTHNVDKNYYDEYDSPEEGCYDSEPDGYCDAPYAFPESYYYTGDYNTDYYPRTTPVSGTLPGWFNQPPTADAGADFSAECASPSGASVSLDGSGSTDTDGDTLTYTWTAADGTELASGVTPNVSLELGTHVITLTVDDGNGETSTNSVTVTVADTTPPVITITGITDGATYDFGLVPVADSVVTDICSTTLQVTEDLTGGDGMDLGLFTFNVVAVDASGNIANESPTYEVIATQAGLTAHIEGLVASGVIPANTGNNLLNMLNNAQLGGLLNRLEALMNHLNTPGQAEADQIPVEVVNILINAVHYMINTP